MNIVHVTPSAPYNENWGYQDNLLPRYHNKMGHTVTMITTNTMYKDGKIMPVECCDKMLDDGVRLIRLAKKEYPFQILTNLYEKIEILEWLRKIEPDCIFFHGLISTTINDAIIYKKEREAKGNICNIVQDNHLDYNIAYEGKNKLNAYVIRSFYRHLNRKSIKYVNRVYGVTPWRKEYAENYFGIPHSKTDILIMGAEDEKIDFKHKENIRKSYREKNGVCENDFLIVTGGKLDEKKNIDLLMEVCASINGVKLMIFGSVQDNMKEKFGCILNGADNIIFVGWIAADEVYNYFFAADLCFFPGQHSVLWEQACACKVPCVFEKWDGMGHVNNGGNSDFVFPINRKTIENKIKELQFTDKYYRMKSVAESKKTDIYLYSKIAEKSLECMKSND